MKCIFRATTGLIALGVLAAGATVLVIGKERAIDLAKGVQSAAAEQMLDHPDKLERQVEKLRASYPERIATLRNAIRQQETHLAHVERDQEMCMEVLELCQEDLDTLRPQIDHATIAMDQGSPAAIEFRGRIYSVNEAEGLAGKAVETHEAYTQRYNALADEAELIQHELGLLSEELATVRAEQESFEQEYRAIRREIDRIKHNERLIKMAEERRQAREGITSSKDELANLTSLREELSGVRTLQEEQMRALKVSPKQTSYEDRAKLRLHDDDASKEAGELEYELEFDRD